MGKACCKSCKMLVLFETLKLQKKLNCMGSDTLIAMVKICQACNYAAVTMSRRVVFGVLFLHQVSLAASDHISSMIELYKPMCRVRV